MAAIKDHYIRALQFAESKSEFTLEELVSELRLTETQEKQLALQIHDKQLFQQNSNSYINSYKGSNIQLHLTVEDKIKLLNYTTLEEARASSLSATRFAIAALLISITSFVVSALLSLKQINSDINIPHSFVQKIGEISKNQAESVRGILQANHALTIKAVSEISEKQSNTNNHLTEINESIIKNQKPHTANNAVPRL